MWNLSKKNKTADRRIIFQLKWLISWNKKLSNFTFLGEESENKFIKQLSFYKVYYFNYFSVERLHCILMIAKHFRAICRFLASIIFRLFAPLQAFLITFITKFISSSSNLSFYLENLQFTICILLCVYCQLSV